MGNFNKGAKFGGGRGGNRESSGNRRDFGGKRGGGNVEMHKARCSDCGNSCEVPFRPSGDKPIFCSDCFRKKDKNDSRDFRDSGKRDFGNNKGTRPSFSDRRPQQNDGGKSTENYKEQFEKLNTKLDKILKALSPSVYDDETKINSLDSKRHQKAPKKEVDTDALRDVITKSIKKKKPAKKAVKKVTKKSSTKSKKTAKKKVVKKKKK